MQPILGLVVPCFNEHEMLEETIKQFIAKRDALDKQMDEKLQEIMDLLGVK